MNINYIGSKKSLVDKIELVLKQNLKHDKRSWEAA